MTAPNKRTAVWLLAAILALGAFLRLYHLGTASLWIDEITFVRDSELGSVAAIWNRMLGTYRQQHQPALPRIVESLWLTGAKQLGLAVNECTYRLPAAIMGTASIVVMYLLGRRLFDARVGLAAAFLLSVSFLAVYYSREAYNYSPFLLCALLSWWFLARLMGALQQNENPATADLVGYGLATALTIQMSMSGIVFALSQLAPIGAAFWQGKREQSRSARARRLAPILLAHAAAWVPMAPFVRQLLHYESADESLAQAVGLISFVQMIGEMGWGSRPFALLCFGACVLSGLWLGLARPTTRPATVHCLLVGALNGVAIGVLELWGRYETRYFLAVLPCLLLFAAVAWTRAAELVSIRFMPSHRVAAWGVPGLALLLWHVPIYDQLFQLKGKLLAGRAVAEWLNRNAPEGAVYLFDYPWALVDVPSMYPTPGRHALSVPGKLHDAYDDEERLSKLRGFTQDVVHRFPDIYYIHTQHFRDEGPSDLEAWRKQTFRRRARIEDPALRRLLEMGVFPSGAFYPNGRSRLKTGEVLELWQPTDIYFNTTDDLLAGRRAAGHTTVALFGAGWLCTRLEDGTIWRGLQAEATIDLHGLMDQETRTTLTLLLGNFGSNETIRVTFDGNETSHALPEKQLTPVVLNDLRLRPGHSVASIRRATPQRSQDFPSVLAYEVKTTP